MSVEEIKVVKTASCPSLSGRSTISYEIGSKGDTQFIRLSGNTAGGLYCKEWVPMADIQQLLSESGKLTSKTLQPIYAGRSSNSPGFLCACALNEKLHAAEKSPADQKSPPSKPAKAKKKAEEQS